MRITRFVYRCLVVTLFLVVKNAIQIVISIIEIPWLIFIRFKLFTKLNKSYTGQRDAFEFPNESVESLERLTIDMIVYKKHRVSNVRPKHLRADNSCLT